MFDRRFKIMTDGAIHSGLSQIGFPGYKGWSRWNVASAVGDNDLVAKSRKEITQRLGGLLTYYRPVV